MTLTNKLNMKSNLKINSNVFLRKIETPLAEDKDFLPHVRGVKAVRKLLWKAYEIYPDSSPNSSEVMSLLKTNKLTEAQWNALKWGIFCYRCNAIPVGQTFKGTVEFRCQQKDCK